MNVYNYGHISRNSPVYNRVNPFEKFRVNSVRFFGERVAGPLGGQADRIEARLLDDVEILLFNYYAPCAFGRRLKCVPEVYSPAKQRIHFEGVWFCWCGVWFGGNNTGSSEQNYS
jgi:hypothetical protein